MSEPVIDIDLSHQSLALQQNGVTHFRCLISSAVNGPGEQKDSGCTPTGWHRIRARIGEGCVANTVFVGRRPTGEIYNAALARKHPQRDWILTRILWLCGEERGHNRLGNVDSMQRYIYIHGTPDNEPMGVAASHGCIRMHNRDLLHLFDLVTVATRVYIHQ